jgi:DUF1680 family protein
VNLYIPSSVRWTQDGGAVSLTQEGSYPYDSLIVFEITTSKPIEFGINFRIPGWAQGASVSVNGKPIASAVKAGSFTRVRREWKTGDVVELDLPLTQRLQAVDARHPKTVALLSGPLVLFPITDKAPAVTGPQLLAAKTVGNLGWRVETGSGMMKLLPFTAIRDEAYTTYVVIP